MISHKGFYEILGTFFLIVVLVAVTIGYLAFQNGFLLVRQGVNKELNDYSLSMVIRDRLTSCFGSTLEPTRMENLQCQDGSFLDIESIGKLIRGYHVERDVLFNCSVENWGWNNSEKPAGIPSEFVFLVPVLDEENNHNCLGKMMVVI